MTIIKLTRELIYNTRLANREANVRNGDMKELFKVLGERIISL